MTTDNKTLAVDVLAVMDREAKLARHYRIENGAVKIAEEASADACAARAAFAELIEAVEAERKGDYFDSEVEFWSDFSNRRRKQKERVAAALARAKGESA